MDIATYLQRFESSLSSYTGDDPLDPWDRFVEHLEERLPADGGSGLSPVFDSLVQRFLNVEQYANDVRYVNYCIRCASYYSEPVDLYSHCYSKGVGTTTAAFYVAWAQQYEHKGMNEQADAMYQKAMEKQAQPAETVLSEYRQFQSRTRSQAPASRSRNPLQTSQLSNQMSHREPAAQMKASVDCPPKPPTHRTTIIVSRSETSGTVPSSQVPGDQTVSEYMTDELACEGSELCFEEVRAEKYFRQLKERRDTMEARRREADMLDMKGSLENQDQDLEVCGGSTSQPSSQRLSVVEAAASLNPHPTQHAFGRPRPSHRLSSRRSLGLRLHTEPAFIQEAAVPEPPPQQRLNAAAADADPVTSEASHHPSVLRSAPADQASVSGTSAARQLNGPAEALCRWDDGVQPSGVENNAATQPAELEEKLNMSQGAAANLSHITPNTSLGYVQATPSKVLPSPTVNTREALDVIMDMFQAPTLLEDPFNSASALHAAETEFDPGYQRNGGVSSFTKPPTSAPFTVFQDDADKENGSAAAPSAAGKSKPIRALAEITVSNKPNETPPELTPDESTMWGARYNSLNSLAACPNSTSDFAMLAQFVSTPFTHKAPLAFFEEDEENKCDGGDADANALFRRQTKKLSPIIEQSPVNDSGSSQIEPPSAGHGTIVGEGLAKPQYCLTTSSITMVQPPPHAVLSFRDQTLCPTDSSVPRTTAAPGWEVDTSPEQASLLAQRPPSSVRPHSEPFTIMEDSEEPASPERVQVRDVPMSPESAVPPDWLAVGSPEEVRRVEPDLDAFLSPRLLSKVDSVPNGTTDVPMSPGCAVPPDWLAVGSPEEVRRVEPDLDAFLSPRLLSKVDSVPNRTTDVPMSPQQPPLCAHDVPMSPAQPPPFSTEDEAGTSPDAAADVSMSAAVEAARPASDPWDDELISSLLSSLRPPLTSHPSCSTWQCNVPNISTNTVISMGQASLRVVSVLGKGAFATVYLATDPLTGERMMMKVQKPANPWEFYINTQLDARLRPDVRHLFTNIRSAHLFLNGSVMLGDLHSCGTLLNAVNMYKTLGSKVMPQPLAMYFTVCVLHMVEQLHAVHIVHADIKPDNFLLGNRFLDMNCFEPDNLDHGLVLIDLGQSIDMELFPEGTAFTAKCLTSGFQCTEMLSGKPWNYQTDYFGVAGTVYCMLFGTYMKVRNEDGVWKTDAVFRRNPHSDLWLQLFHTLLNVPDGGSLPSLRSLRGKLTEVLQQNYSNKLRPLKNRLTVLLLENWKMAR